MLTCLKGCSHSYTPRMHASQPTYSRRSIIFSSPALRPSSASRHPGLQHHEKGQEEIEDEPEVTDPAPLRPRCPGLYTTMQAVYAGLCVGRGLEHDAMSTTRYLNSAGTLKLVMCDGFGMGMVRSLSHSRLSPTALLTVSLCPFLHWDAVEHAVLGLGMSEI